MTASIHPIPQTRATSLEEDGVVSKRDRQALIYGAVGHLSPLDPTPTQ